MARPYTVLLASRRSTAIASNSPLFTARLNFVTIVRDVLFTNLEPAPQLFQLKLGTGPTAVIWLRTMVAVDSFLHLDLRQVVQPSASMTYDSGGALHALTITGYELEA